MPRSQKISPCLWFDGNAEEAASFYVSLFPGSAIVKRSAFGGDNPVTVAFELDGTSIVALNGGPQFKFTPAISLFVMCESRDEIDTLWARLTDGGSAMMPLDTYPWSERYGWAIDRFGMTWQLMLGPVADVGQKVAPCLLFVGGVFGRGEEALRLYTSLFPDSAIDGILHYGPNEDGREGTVKHAQFALAGCKFMVMDGPGEHAFTFNEAVSLIIHCHDQAEIDRFWSQLTANGGTESMCGWLKDPFGVSWQVVPEKISELLARPEAIQAMFGMKKLDIAALKNAH
ncbi:MAG: hypothetical protein DIJKHBIC_02029 [Thermoanaerobaculia bacterium]|nr:hypothetical protein [Thermoanaerobaculia bacterium]